MRKNMNRIGWVCGWVVTHEYYLYPVHVHTFCCGYILNTTLTLVEVHDLRRERTELGEVGAHASNSGACTCTN